MIVTGAEVGQVRKMKRNMEEQAMGGKSSSRIVKRGRRRKVLNEHEPSQDYSKGKFFTS